MSGHGGTGRRVRLRGVWATIRVQVPVTAPKKRQPTGCLFFGFRDFKLLRNLTATQFEPVFRCTLKLRFRCKASPLDRTKTSEQSYLLRFFYVKKNLRLTACSSFSSKATAFSDLCLRHSMLICLKNSLFKRIQYKLFFYLFRDFKPNAI